MIFAYQPTYLVHILDNCNNLYYISTIEALDASIRWNTYTQKLPNDTDSWLVRSLFLFLCLSIHLAHIVFPSYLRNNSWLTQFVLLWIPIFAHKWWVSKCLVTKSLSISINSPNMGYRVSVHFARDEDSLEATSSSELLK